MLDLILVQVEFSYFFTPLLSRGARMCIKYAEIFKRAKVTAGKNRTAQGTAHYVSRISEEKGFSCILGAPRVRLAHAADPLYNQLQTAVRPTSSRSTRSAGECRVFNFFPATRA
jgi:hypothetical protein